MSRCVIYCLHIVRWRWRRQPIAYFSSTFIRTWKYTTTDSHYYWQLGGRHSTICAIHFAKCSNQFNFIPFDFLFRSIKPFDSRSTLSRSMPHIDQNVEPKQNNLKMSENKRKVKTTDRKRERKIRREKKMWFSRRFRLPSKSVVFRRKCSVTVTLFLLVPKFLR